jgi:hypothetical protein
VQHENKGGGAFGLRAFFGEAGTEVAQEKNPLTVESEMSGVKCKQFLEEECHPENDQLIAGVVTVR